MTVFNQSIIDYVSGPHAIKRVKQRLNIEQDIADYFIREKALQGKILLDIKNHRYIKNGELFFPCVKIKNNLYKVKSVLTWDMVSERFQYILDNIDKYDNAIAI